jgi:site-specific DNA-methyltransferase (adenine-specific)
MVAGVFDNIEEAENFAAYLRTRFVRFLIRQRKISQHNRPDTFAFVPALPMDTKWTDAQLFKKYGISDVEQQYINSIIRAMPADADLEDEEDE